MKFKIVVFLLLTISLLAIFFQYHLIRKPQIGALGEKPSFTFYENYTSIKAAGYLKWSNQRKQPSDFRQYFLIHVKGYDSKVKCEILDIWDRAGSSISLSEPEDCTIISLDKTKKIVMVSYKDSIFIIDENETTFKSGNKEESGGGSLVSNYLL